MFGWPEILILAVIVILLFGIGRIGKIGSEFGRGIRNFREGLKEEKGEPDEKSSDNEKK